MSGQFNLIFMTQWLVELQDLVHYSNSVDQKIVVQMGGKVRGKKTHQEDFLAIQARVNNGSPWLAPVRLRKKEIKTGELMEAKSAVVVVQSLSRVRLFMTPQTLAIDTRHQLTILCPWDFPGKNTGVGCHFLLHGIFPTQGSNLGLLHCRKILYQLSHQGSPMQWDLTT